MAAGATARRKPTCSAIMVPWLKPTSASADGGRLRRASSASRKALSVGRGGVDAGPALVRIAERQRKPFAADRRLPARVRRMRRHEGGIRQQTLPGAADVDQVVAVGAIAVQEHDELLGRAGARLEARAVEFGHRDSAICGFPFRRFLVGFLSASLSLFCAAGFCRFALNRHHVALLHRRDNRPTTDAPPRRATAARLRAILVSALASGRLRKFERDARGFLHGEIAGRKGVGMAEAEQQIDIGGPRPDAVQRGEQRVRGVGIHVADGVEIDARRRRPPCRFP